jgi:hypothetical protein
MVRCYVLYHSGFGHRTNRRRGAPPSVGCLSGLQLYRVRRGKRNGRRVEFSH